MLATCNILLISHITAQKMSKNGVFSRPHFPVFGLNTEIYGVSSYSN